MPAAQPAARSRRYEDRLAADRDWALSEGSKYFVGEGEVRATLDHITRRLNALGVPYAVVGGLALYHHGFRRFTEDVDILVTADGLRVVHERLVGLGFVPPFTGSRHLRDTATGVKVEFHVTGGFPGDGKLKGVAFPDPADVGVEANGVRYLNLPTLVRLKLASGLSAAHRGKDLVDVQELIRAARLPRTLAEQLHPEVRAKYLELWDVIPRRFVRVVPIASPADPQVAAMLADGVTSDPAGGTTPDYVTLTTSDPAVASKYAMRDEADLWDDAGRGRPPAGRITSRGVSPMLKRTVLSLAAVVVVAGLAAAAVRLGKIELKDFKFKGEVTDAQAGYNEGDGKLFFYAPATAEAEVKLPADGEYTITVEASCDAAQNENAKFTLKVGEVTVKKDFLLTQTEAKEYTFTAKLKKGDPKLSVEFTNDVYKENEYDRNLYVHGVKVEAKK